jgi:hypothetical protein
MLSHNLVVATALASNLKHSISKKESNALFFYTCILRPTYFFQQTARKDYAEI